MAPKEPVLSLSTLAPDRPVIEIDKIKYEIAVPGDLGLVEVSKLDALKPRILAFGKIKGSPTPKAMEDMASTLQSFVELVILKCDKSVTDKLGDQQRMAIVEVFTGAAATNARKIKKATAGKKRSHKKKNTTTAKT